MSAGRTLICDAGYGTLTETSKMAERVRFELTDPCESTVFKTAAFGHSATSPLPKITFSNTSQKKGESCANFLKFYSRKICHLSLTEISNLINISANITLPHE
jgi:hypothetical protein